jgi:hypothetical protein
MFDALGKRQQAEKQVNCEPQTQCPEGFNFVQRTGLILTGNVSRWCQSRHSVARRRQTEKVRN